VIEDDVEIGANSARSIAARWERRAFGAGQSSTTWSTWRHNCDIGEDAILVALTGISGSSTIGKGAVLAGRWASATMCTWGRA
jgi:UDP-3-O-[3-hydroxymyristoyl] glucosamine N-acyltransferase